MNTEIVLSIFLLGLLFAWFVVDVFNLRPNRNVEGDAFEDILEDLVSELRELPGDFVTKLKESGLLDKIQIKAGELPTLGVEKKPTAEAKPPETTPKERPSLRKRERNCQRTGWKN